MQPIPGTRPDQTLDPMQSPVLVLGVFDGPIGGQSSFSVSVSPATSRNQYINSVQHTEYRDIGSYFPS